MKKAFLYFIGAFFFEAFLSTIAQQDEATKKESKVLRVPFEGTVELGLAPYILRSLEYAEENGFDTVVLEVDTFGGRVDAAVRIRDALIDTPLRTIAWVNKRAISAGALISIACDEIYFSPGSTMGAATPIKGGGGEAKDVGKKFVSYFRSEMGSTAEQSGRKRKIAEAMVTATEDIEGLVKEGDVLTLTDVTAKEVGYSNGSARNFQEVLEQAELSKAFVEDFEINWAERIVRVLTNPTVSGLLMSGGVLGIIFELQSPGFGIPGIVGVSALALFFFSKFLVHLAGWEEVLFLLIGLILIGIEIFLFPGSFVFAVAGFLLIVASLFFAGISPRVPFDFSLPSVEEHLQSMATGMVTFFIGLALILWFFSRNPHSVPLALEDHFDPGDGSSTEQKEARHDLIGKTGVLMTDLRPAGKIKMDDRFFEVVSEGPFLAQGTEVEVIDIQGVRIVVREKPKGIA